MNTLPYAVAALVMGSVVTAIATILITPTFMIAAVLGVIAGLGVARWVSREK